MKKGEMSVWVIISFVLGALIVVVLSLMLLTNVGPFSDSCENVGGTCRTDCYENEFNSRNACSDSAPKCCVPLGDEDDYY